VVHTYRVAKRMCGVFFRPRCVSVHHTEISRKKKNKYMYLQALLAYRLILFTGLIACVFSYNSIIRAYKLVAASVNDFQWVLRELFKYIYVQIHICVYLAQRAPPSVVPPPDPPPPPSERNGGGGGKETFCFFCRQFDSCAF